MKTIVKLFCLIAIGVMLPACSSSYITGSWASPEFKGQIKSVYIVGIAKKEVNRRIFEDTFSRELSNHGVRGISSYKDLAEGQKMDDEIIKQKMKANGADSVIMTQLVNQRTESVTSPGRVSGYSSGPYYGGRGYNDRPNYYRNWGSYYNRRVDITYEPPTTTEYLILTVESVLYDLKTGEMIWSGQLETVVESSIEKMMQDYVQAVAKDLKGKGLI